jgi:uncharacterized protein
MKVFAGLLVALSVGLAAGCNRPEAASAQTNDAPVGAAASTPAPSRPALWRTGDEDTTIYLFGAVHVLPRELNWRTDTLDKAFADSGTVYFETDLDPNPVEMSAMVTRLGLYPRDKRLTDQLTPDQRTALVAAAAEMQVEVSSLDRMRPWLAATTLSQRLIVQSGYDPMSGVERILSPMAVQSGKMIRKLESIEDQLKVFANLPDEVQLKYLIEGLKEIDAETVILNNLVEAWRIGDVEGLNRIMIEEDMADQQDVYEALLVNRNRNWTVQLDQLIDSEPGVFFVAVGAAHLAGKDSVIAMLEAEGRASVRVQ